MAEVLKVVQVGQYAMRYKDGSVGKAIPLYIQADANIENAETSLMNSLSEVLSAAYRASVSK